MHRRRICSCGRTIAVGAECLCRRERERRRQESRPSASARGYDSRWQEERAAYLKVNAQCRRCGAPATVVDHIIPHKGDRHLFWSRSNWSALCKPCHDRKTATRDGGFGRRVRCEEVRP